MSGNMCNEKTVICEIVRHRFSIYNNYHIKYLKRIKKISSSNIILNHYRLYS